MQLFDAPEDAAIASATQHSAHSWSRRKYSKKQNKTSDAAGILSCNFSVECWSTYMLFQIPHWLTVANQAVEPTKKYYLLKWTNVTMSFKTAGL